MQGKSPSGAGKGNNWALDKWVELVYFEDAARLVLIALIPVLMGTISCVITSYMNVREGRIRFIAYGPWSSCPSSSNGDLQ